MKKGLTLAGVAAAIAIGATSAKADGMMIAAKGALSARALFEVGQEAVIWKEGQTETLTLRTGYQSDGGKFVWIIPVPEKPTVEAGNKQMFEAIDKYTTPKKPWYDPIMDWMDSASGHKYGTVSLGLGIANEVNLVSRKMVDAYDVSVLEATNAQSLRNWLEKNGYEYPESRQHLLKYYIDKGWQFVAAKIDSAEKAGTASPLKISFQSAQTVYPLKISGPEIVPTPMPYQRGGVIAAYSFENMSSEKFTIKNIGKEAWDGSYVLAMEGDWNMNHLPGLYLVPGRSYTLSAYAKGVGKYDHQVEMSVSPTKGRNGTQGFTLDPEGKWKRIQISFVADQEKTDFSLQGEAYEYGSFIYWDGIQIQEGDVATAFGAEIVPTSAMSREMSNQAQRVNICVFDTNKQIARDFNIKYAGKVPTEKLLELTGHKFSQPMYLTCLSRSFWPADMEDDVYIEKAGNDDSYVPKAITRWPLASVVLMLANVLGLIAAVVVLGLMGARALSKRKKK